MTAVNLYSALQQSILREAWDAHQARIEAGEDFLASRTAYYRIFDHLDELPAA